jgi:hypothetical protein
MGERLSYSLDSRFHTDRNKYPDAPGQYSYRSVFEHDGVPVASVIHYPIAQFRYPFLFAEGSFAGTPVYEATITVTGPQRVGIGLSSWIEAERHFWEEQPEAVRITWDACHPQGWTTRHLDDVWKSLERTGYSVGLLWSGHDGNPGWLWQAR